MNRPSCNSSSEYHNNQPKSGYPTGWFWTAAVLLVIISPGVAKETLKYWLYLEAAAAQHRTIDISLLETDCSDQYRPGEPVFPDPALLSVVNDHVDQILYYSVSLRALVVRAAPAAAERALQLPGIAAATPVKSWRSERSAPEQFTPLGKLDNGPDNAELVQLSMLKIPDLHTMGFTGKGIRIAIFDTGFRKDHVAFRAVIDEGRLVGEKDFVFNDGNVQDEIPADTTSSRVQHFHGTAVWSIIAANGSNGLTGVAPDAEFLLAKTEREGSETRIEEDYFVAAIEWAYNRGAQIVNVSLGYRDFDDFVYPFSALDGKTAVTSRAVNWAMEHGILVVASAGNDNTAHFPDGGIGSPAEALGALAVGAVNSSRVIASWSSHGPTADGRIKPEVCAMGVGTRMAFSDTRESYGTGNGTSFAAPLIAGAAALLLESNRLLSPAEIIRRLKTAGDRARQPDHVYGWGIPNLLNAWQDSAAIPLDSVGIERNALIVFPNPAKTAVVIVWEWKKLTNQGCLADLRVIDIRGHLVNQQQFMVGMSGAREQWVWDLADYRGHRVTAGVYLLFIDLPGERRTAKLLIMH